VSPTTRSEESGAAWPEPVYLDASALVKLLVPEPESDTLNEALVGAEDVVISDLALTEIASALGRRMRENRLAMTEARRLQGEAEKLARACRRVELTPPVHRRAERLLLSSRKVPLRALDALHVATALAADAATLVTYDPRLRAAALAQGLFVAPEATPPE
jgi:predicted nucleic acid-binding protein